MTAVEIRTLEEGELITEPGFYQISLEVHHSHPVEGPSVTSSTLRDMELRTPGYVWAFHPKNPYRYVKKDTDAKRLGRAMAYVVEGSAQGAGIEAGLEMLLDHFRVLPEDAPGRPTAAQIAAFERDGHWSEKAQERVDWWEEWDTDPRPILKPEEFKNIALMGEALIRDPGGRGAMKGGLPEVTMAWRDEKTGVWCLSRPDVVNLDGTVVDYKKMATQGRPFDRHLVDRRITEHAYDMQLAFAAEGFEYLTGGMWPSMAAIVAQHDEPPYFVILDEINEEDLRLGQWRNQFTLRRFAECWEQMKKGEPLWRAWPGPGFDPATYQRPDWQAKQLQERKDQTSLAEKPPPETDDDDPLDDPGLAMMG